MSDNTSISEEFTLDGELMRRMVSVLEWVAYGDSARFDDYSRVALEVLEEAESVLLGGWRR